MGSDVLLIIAIAALWSALWQSLGSATLVSGVAIGIVVAWLLARISGRPSDWCRMRAIIAYIGLLLWDLWLSSIKVAMDVITPTDRTNERLVEFKTRLTDPVSVATFASSITLTPGSLTVVYDEGPEPVLLIHLLYADDVDKELEQIRALEDRLISCSIKPPEKAETSDVEMPTTEASS